MLRTVNNTDSTRMSKRSEYVKLYDTAASWQIATLGLANTEI